MLETQEAQARLHFNEERDLILLREVYEQNPFEVPSRWRIIQVNLIQLMGRSISIRTLKERVQNLVKKYLNRARDNERKSGIEVEVTELDDLLQLISEIMKNSTLKSAAKSGKISDNNTDVKTSYQQGFDIRELASNNLLLLDQQYHEQQMDNTFLDVAGEEVIASSSDFPYQDTLATLNQSRNLITEQAQIPQETNKEKMESKSKFNIATPMRKRGGNLTQNSIQYLTKKNEKNFQLKERQLHTEERKLALEEKKHELDDFERKKWLEFHERILTMEEKRLEMQLHMFYNQQDLIKLVFSQQPHQ